MQSTTREPKMKNYTVTITPKITTYAGSSTFGESTETIYAQNRADAIKTARRRYRNANGREAVPASFRAVEAA